MATLAFLQNIGGLEWLLILLAVLLLFGASRIPQLARSLGKSASEFKKGLKEGQEEEAAEEKEDEDKDKKT
jgi:sec-independent protein translocase protein TatA